MFRDRQADYREIERLRGSKLLVYVTGDRPGLETQIHPEVLDFFVDHLDVFNKVSKISLYLYTRGGATTASWSIANLIQQFCDEFEVIVPSKAHSGGTLLSLGAKRIIMSKQATLGPIDPSVNTPLNPQIPGAPPNAKVPVSVEAINGFIELVKKEFNVKNASDLANIVGKLSDKIHPLVLGEVVRARSQIKMLANRLLSTQMTDKKKIKKIINFLASESGSHDYTINRKEAEEGLGLNIEKPDSELYPIIKRIYDDIRNELHLNEALDFNSLLGTANQIAYTFRRALIESLGVGTHVFVSEGQVSRQQIQLPNNVIQFQINDQRTFEGWKYERI